MLQLNKATLANTLHTLLTKPGLICKGFDKVGSGLLQTQVNRLSISLMTKILRYLKPFDDCCPLLNRSLLGLIMTVLIIEKHYLRQDHFVLCIIPFFGCLDAPCQHDA